MMEELIVKDKKSAEYFKKNIKLARQRRDRAKIEMRDGLR